MNFQETMPSYEVVPLAFAHLKSRSTDEILTLRLWHLTGKGLRMQWYYQL
jgi:hypothetical protein